MDSVRTSDSKQEPLKQPHRRLVLMFDGTGDTRICLSNVARMFEAIDDSTLKDYLLYSNGARSGPSGSCGVDVQEPNRQVEQLVKYIKGVGTESDIVMHLSGLGFGYGLSANVIAGYVWLSNNYQEGDDIFVFGFSRGAFSARSLVSLVHRCGGVLKKPSLQFDNNPKLEDDNAVVTKAYAMYQAYVRITDRHGVVKKNSKWNTDFNNKWDDFEFSAAKACYLIHRVPVKMLGVWDTVGALGALEGFHDQGLSCIVENAYHALAIDDHRFHFAPTLWNKVTSGNQEVKQVWFVGSHCNVGGGAGLDKSSNPDELWLYSYVWMQKYAQKQGLRFFWTYNSPVTQKVGPFPRRRVSLREIENSYSLFVFGLYKHFISKFDREVVETNGAKLHWSVKDRITVSAKPNDTDQPPYHPPSLFGKAGTEFTNAAPDTIEIHKLDNKNSDLVRKVVWQIEPDYETVKCSNPLPSLENDSNPLPSLTNGICNCLYAKEHPTEQSIVQSHLG